MAATLAAADTAGDTGPLPGDLPPFTSQRFQIGNTASIHKTLVDAVHLKRRDKSGDGLHHPVGNIGIETVIAGGGMWVRAISVGEYFCGVRRN